MDWEQEKEIYAAKLERLIEGIDKIQAIQGNRIMTPQMDGKLAEIRREAQKLVPKLKKGEFEIAIVGLEKAGKSSFANALLGRKDCLPTEDKRCTYTSTCIRPAEGPEKALVEFYSQAEFDRNFHEKLEKMGIPNASEYFLGSLSLDRYRQLFNDLPQEKQILYSATLNKDICNMLENRDELKKYIGTRSREFSGAEMDHDEFKAFIREPGKAIAVKNVTIYSSMINDMKDSVIYDVPGFDSPTAMHREQTEDKMDDADVVVMVANAKEPSIKLQQLEIFQYADRFGCQVRDKMFVFANKADMVDSLEQLRKNMNEVYDEWINNTRILDEKYRNSRIFFGSANAHLGIRGDNADPAEVLGRYGLTSGVRELWGGLADFYRNERFEILKKRIDALRRETQAVFADVDKNFSSRDDYFTSDEVLNMVTALHDEKIENIRKSLENLSYEIRTKCLKEAPLKKDIMQRIDSCFGEGKIVISDEELAEIHKSLITTSDSPQPTPMDTKLREKYFSALYARFCDEVLGCATSMHADNSEKIIDVFMDNLNVTKSNPDYETLRKDTADLCGLHESRNNDYYKSLLERFARDLFEAQIKFSRRDRLEKFRDDAASFFSMGVYYDQSENQQGGIESFASSALDSRLWRIIFYPEQVRENTGQSAQLADVLEEIRKRLNVQALGPALEALVGAIVRSRGNAAWAAIEIALAGINKSGPASSKISGAAEALTLLTETEKSSPMEILFGGKYLDDLNRKHANYSYAQVRDELYEDIRALRDALFKAFVPAVDLDKAFNARQTKLIEDIISGLGKPAYKFRGYINRNYRIILRDAMSEINREAEMRKLDGAVYDQIRSILQNISSLQTA